MAGIYAYSTTPGSNTSVGGISIAEGMSPANVNDAIRQLMADLKTSVAAPETFINGSAPLPIANGGTGAASAAAALTALGGLETAYRDLPVTTATGAFTFADTDRGGLKRYTGAAAAATINPFGTTPINVGGVIVVRNAGSGALTITRGAGVVLKIAGQATDQNVVVAVNGYCSLIQEATNVWLCIGTGIS